MHAVFQSLQLKEINEIFDIYHAVVVEEDPSFAAAEGEQRCLDTQNTFSALRATGLMITAEDESEIEMHLDLECESKCSYDQYLRLLLQYDKPPPSKDELADAFKALDRDQSGTISTAEFKHTVKVLGGHVTDEELESLIKAADQDGDGEVDFEEFTKLLTTSLLSVGARFLE